jgi:hypothetical protein
MARGQIFGWLGADDTYEPGAVMTVVEFFRANPDAYFIYGDCNLTNEAGEIIGKTVTRDFDLDELINNTNFIPCPSTFYKREVIEKIGFMDTSIHACDLDYWIRVGKMFPIHRIDKVLSNFRVHKGSISGSPAAGKMYIRDDFTISRRHGGSLFSPRARRYYKMVVVESLRPFLGFAYPLANRVLSLAKIVFSEIRLLMTAAKKSDDRHST